MPDPVRPADTTSMRRSVRSLARPAAHVRVGAPALLLAVTGVLLAAPAGADTALVTLPVGLDDPLLALAARLAVTVPGSPATVTVATTVTDLRLAGTGWTSTVSATDLTLVGASSPGASETLPATSMTAYTGDVNPLLLGTVSITGEYTSGSPLTLSNAAQTLLTATGRTNANTAVFTTTVLVPTAGKTAGIYTGSVTQSVS